MASETLSSVVLEILENNLKTSKSFIESYRKGGMKIASRIESGWEQVVDKGASRLDKKIRTRLVDGGQKVTNFLSNRVAGVSDTAESAMDKVYDGATKAIEKVSSKVGGVDNKYASKYFDYVGKATLPGAKLALNLSNRLADGVDSLYGKIAAKPATVRKSPAKRARSAKKAA
jgi:phage-related protein